MNKLQEKIYNALAVAYANDDCTLTDEKLAKKYKVSRQMINMHVQGLRHKGMIARNPRYRPVE